MIVTEWLRRLWYLINRRRLERELQQDMEAHRERMGEPQRFGNTLRLREEARDVWGWNWLDDLGRDIGCAARNLRRSPGFTAGAVVLLSLGLGLNLAVFQVFYIARLRPLPIRDIDSLVLLEWVSKDGRARNVPYPAVQFLAAHNSVFSATMTRNPGMVLWGDAGTYFQSALVSVNWFDELGYGAAMGRVFHAGTDDQPGAAPAVVVSHRFWEGHLDGNPNVIGQTVRINNKAATLIGVAPAGFQGVNYENPQIWIPVDQTGYFSPGGRIETSWDENAILYARLRPGISAAAVRDASRNVLEQLAELLPNLFQKGDWLEPSYGTTRFQRRSTRQQDWMAWATLGTLSGIVLLIVCANVGNLVLSRSVGRLREWSVRAALGAGRGRIIRHLLTESLLLAGMGFAGACIAGYWGLTLFLRIAAADAPAIPLGELDPTLVLFAVFSVMVVTLAVGLLPALRISREDLIASMKDGGQQTTLGLERAKLRSALLAVQVAGTCILLMLAGQIVRGFQRTQSPPGFAFEKMAILDLARDRFAPKGEEARAYWNAVRDAVAANPETDGVSLVAFAPLGLHGMSVHTTADAPGLKITVNEVEAGFFHLMEIPLLAGRTFEAGDDPTKTIIISRSVARTMYGTLDVLGKGFPKSKPRETIVGVVEDARVVRLEDSSGAEQYSPLNDKEGRNRVLLVRAKSDIGQLASAVKDTARAVDDRFTPDVRLLKAEYDLKLKGERDRGMAAASGAGLALLLACLGIFSVVSYSVTLRRKEIGIRLALGADSRAIAGVLMKNLVWPVFGATFVGLILGIAASKVMESQQANFKALDPVLLITVGLVIAGSGAIAAIVPTFRALRTDVLQVLRYE